MQFRAGIINGGGVMHGNAFGFQKAHGAMQTASYYGANRQTGIGPIPPDIAAEQGFPHMLLSYEPT
jgi:hypothetical protein